MKKVFSVFVSVLFLSIVLLAGCNSSSSGGGSEGGSGSESAGNDTSQSNSSSSSGEEEKAEVAFPEGDITFIVPNGPGGGNDLTTRSLIPGMEEILGVEVVPENQPASKGVVAAVNLTEAEPNGHTLYFNSQTLILLALQGNPIDLSKIQPVAQVVEDTSVIAVPADSPYNTLQDLIDGAKANPGQLKIATNGKGALWDFSAKTFAKAAGIELQYIPYSSGGVEMTKALAAGEVDISANSPGEVKPLVDAGKIKVLAVQSSERQDLFPDVPTTKEAGVDSEFPVWRGVFTSKGVDKAALDKLEEGIKNAWETDEFKQYLENQGMPEYFRGHEEFTEFFDKQVKMYEELLSN